MIVGLQNSDNYEVPLNVGFFPPDSPSTWLNNPGTAVYYFTGTVVCAPTANGTKAALTVGRVKPGVYDIAVDSPTLLMNIKRNVSIP